MNGQAIYTSAMPGYTLAIPEIVGYNDKNEPRVRGSVRFKEGFLKLDLTKSEDLELEKILDNHPMNISNGGSVSTGFRKQKDDITRIQILADGEVYCSMPDDGMQEADTVAIKYLIKAAKVLPPPALKNAIKHSIYVYERFQFAGLPRPKETNTVKIVKARITEIVEALIENKIWQVESDDNSEG